MPQRHNIKPTTEALKKLYGERCINFIGPYVNQSTPFMLECLNCSHKWETTILHKKRCPNCTSKGGSLASIQSKYAERGMRILSSSIATPARPNYKLECLVCGHKWEAPYKRFYSGSGCRKCSRIGTRLTHQYVEQEYLELNIELLSEYKTSYYYNKLKCKNCGHIWEAKRQGGCKGCPMCARLKNRIQEDELAKRFKAKGILLIKYNSPDKSDVQCANCSYKWSTDDRASNKLSRGCPQCNLFCFSGYKAVKQNQCRRIMEEVFKAPFPSIKHPDIRNPETGRALELDGFNPEKKIAFEYQGEQHYIEKYKHFSKLFKKDRTYFEKLKMRDDIKKKRCAELGIALITIPYWVSDIELHIKEAYKNGV